jgi:hypothetical protein
MCFSLTGNQHQAKIRDKTNYYVSSLVSTHTRQHQQNVQYSCI